MEQHFDIPSRMEFSSQYHNLELFAEKKMLLQRVEEGETYLYSITQSYFETLISDAQLKKERFSPTIITHRFQYFFSNGESITGVIVPKVISAKKVSLEPEIHLYYDEDTDIYCGIGSLVQDSLEIRRFDFDSVTYQNSLVIPKPNTPYSIDKIIRNN